MAKKQSNSKNAIEKMDAKYYINKINNWMNNSDFLYKEVDDDDALFHIVFPYSPVDKTPIDIIIPKGKQAYIVIGSGTHVSESHRKAIESMTPEERFDFYWDIKISMLQGSIQYQLTFNEEEVLSQFGVIGYVYFDGFSLNEFYKTIQDVYNTKMRIVGIIQKRMGLQCIEREPDD